MKIQQNALEIHFANLTYTAKRTPLLPCSRAEEFKILKNCTGHVASGELLLIMGSSGSGKTTLLKTLSQRFVDATVEGALFYQIDDDVVGAANPGVGDYIRRNIAFVRQETELIAGLTAYETMVYYYTLMVAPQTKTERENLDMIMGTLKFIGLNNHAHKFVDEMSGGQQRRLQIGTRLLDTPNALFLDEPTAGLDGTTSLKIMYVLQSITEIYDIPVVASIHRPRQEVV
eukprot:jgi/Bigna1/39487/e_gw1.33.63.1